MANTHRKHNPQLYMANNNRVAAYGKYKRHIETCEDCLVFIQGYLGMQNFCPEGVRLMEDYCYYVTKSLEHST